MGVHSATDNTGKIDAFYIGLIGFVMVSWFANIIIRQIDPQLLQKSKVRLVGFPPILRRQLQNML